MRSLELTNFYMKDGVYMNSGHSLKRVFNQKNKIKYNHRKANIPQIFSSQSNASERGRRSSLPSNSVAKPQEKSEKNLYFNDNIDNTTTNGLGILEFLRGKSYFITGVTGFLGKVLIEKILRTSPETRKIYVLIKAETKEAASERLKTEIIDSNIFECLRRVHGKSYEAFMLSKVVPIVGKVGELNLGMHPTLMDEISQQVDVIIHSAANTAFDERYDVSLNINTRGASQVLSFANKSFVNRETKEDHIHTGKPFYISEYLQKNTMDAQIDLGVSFNGNGSTLNMKQLGLERARVYGWRNVYELSKAMGEMLINETRGEIPIVIVRPSIILSTYKEPYPGWIQGNRTIDPLILSYGRGYLPLLIQPEALMDVIPVDMVANTIIASMAKHGVDSKPDLNIYHLSSSCANPLRFYEIFEYCYQYFNLSPMISMMGKKVDIKRIMFVNTKEDFSSLILKETLQQNGLTDAAFLDHKVSQRLNKKFQKVTDFLQRLVEIYEPYVSSTPRFDMDSVEELWEAMSEEEKQRFGFDVKIIDWKDFFMNIHIPGLVKHVKKK